MCTWRPFLSEAVEQISKTRFDRLVILPLFPQFSFTTTRVQAEASFDKSSRPGPRHEVQISSGFRHGLNIPPTLNLSRRRLNYRQFRQDNVQSLSGAHSIPESYVREGDPYRLHAKASVERIMERLGRKNPYSLSFQSKIIQNGWSPQRTTRSHGVRKAGFTTSSSFPSASCPNTSKRCTNSTHPLQEGRTGSRHSELQACTRTQQRPGFRPRAG